VCQCEHITRNHKTRKKGRVYDERSVEKRLLALKQIVEYFGVELGAVPAIESVTW
jgi:hypothetical protein